MSKFTEQNAPKSSHGRNSSEQMDNGNKQNQKPVESGDRNARPQRPEARQAEKT